MKKRKSKKKPTEIYSSKHQVGKSNKKVDAKRKAMAPGKRKSKEGNEYYEYRKNRSDVKGKRV